jgi:hypothetical protein
MTESVRELFAFALQFYRAPLQYRSLVAREGPVPEHFQQLLEILNKRPEHPAWGELAHALSCTVKELREAGFFLVRRVLFVDGADNYRILGLQPFAEAAAVRERYRLLIGLFHPDKNPQGDEWGELYAPKINDAYNVLKSASRKRRYDRQLSPAGQGVPGSRRQARARGGAGVDWGPGGGPASSDAMPVVAVLEQQPPADTDNPFASGFRDSIEPDTVAEPPLDFAASAAPGQDVRPSPAKKGAGPRYWLWGVVFGAGLLAGVAIGMRGADSPPPASPALPGVSAGAPGSNSDDRTEVDEARLAFAAALHKEPVFLSRHRPPAPATAVGSEDKGPVAGGDGAVSPVSGPAVQRTRNGAEPRKTPPPAPLPAGTSPSPADSASGGESATGDRAPQPPRGHVAPPEPVQPGLTPTAVVNTAPRVPPTAAGPEVEAAGPTRDSSPAVAAENSPPSAVAATLEPVDPAPPLPPATPTPVIERTDVERLLGRFIRSYEAGDVRGFASLFTPDALTNEGKGRGVIVSSYGKLFTTSDSRTIQVTDLDWASHEGEGATLSFKVRIEVGQGLLFGSDHFEGDVDMRLVRQERGVLISRFMHQVKRL